MFNKDYYPTPDALIEKMIEGVNLFELNSVLEPSAGKGNIIDYLNKKMDSMSGRYKKYKLDVDCIEIEQNLRYILQGKNYRVVYDDFLRYNSLKAYSLIIANFPFSDGEHHLRKALNMLECSGGKLSCIVNAETILNPYTNTRKEILYILKNNNATIEILEDQFIDAERKTGVKVALIKCEIVKKEVGSVILDNLKQAEMQQDNEYKSNYIVENDFIKAIIKQFNFEAKTGIKLIEEYNKLKAFTSSEFNKENSILDLRIRGDRDYSEPEENKLINNYLRNVRKKYWKGLFENKEFTKLFTDNLRRDFYNKLDELAEYDFNEFNISEIKKQMNNQIVVGVKETILSLFDDFSRKHYWDKDTQNGNIHMFNGWKTNKAWKINRKVIIVLNGFQRWDGDFDPTHYNVINKLTDVEKVFNYLDTGKTEELDLREVMKKAKEEHQTRSIITKFFKIDFMKKGSCHLTFLDEELLKKFNIMAAQEKNWLPPSYSKKSYKDMTKEEKEVVNEFEGQKEYDKVINNTDYYIYNSNDILMLA